MPAVCHPADQRYLDPASASRSQGRSLVAAAISTGGMVTLCCTAAGRFAAISRPPFETWMALTS
jgi:hypothetical protein